MKPAPVDYVAAGSLEEALSLLAEHGSDAKPLAGGQSLIPLLNFRLARPTVLVDLNRLEELAYVRGGNGGGLSLGAMTRHATLESDPLVAREAPLLSAAAGHIAHPQIRNRGTLGGTLAHADPAAELPVVSVALGARFRIARAGGERWAEAAEFFVGLLTADLQPGELVVEVTVPAMPPGSGWAFHELARRTGDYAHAGVAAVLTRSGDACSRARLVYLSLGDGPMRARRAEQLLVAQGVSESTIDEAAALAASSEIEPSGDIHASEAYKRHLARVLTRRALAEAWRRAGDAAGEASGGSA
jgi:carbon-monoxide dehydrogenase medium subunit